MKTSSKLFALGMILMGFGLNANAQSTASANATARIITPIILTHGQDLVFGTIASTSSAGTVEVDTEGVRTGTNVTLSTIVEGKASTYTVTGENNSTYSITLPEDDQVTISNGVAANDMPVKTFTCSYASKESTLSATGTDSFTVGATLHVAANQAVGNYTGSFNVTVNYN